MVCLLDLGSKCLSLQAGRLHSIGCLVRVFSVAIPLQKCGDLLYCQFIDDDMLDKCQILY
jgi:hypothetical protein